MRTRTAEECREQALEVLKLCIPSKKIKTMDMSADVVDAFRKTKVNYIIVIVIIRTRFRIAVIHRIFASSELIDIFIHQNFELIYMNHRTIVFLLMKCGNA